jgi:hypothetical protein
MKKPAQSPKLQIHHEMKCLDLKDRGFYDSLDDQEKKKFSSYLMIRWGSSVVGSSELEAFYLIATNQQLNKHFFSINKHPKLQWLCATAISPAMGVQRHQWIPQGEKNKSKSQNMKKLAELFPNFKNQDLELLYQINDKDDINQYVDEHGQSD